MTENTTDPVQGTPSPTQSAPTSQRARAITLIFLALAALVVVVVLILVNTGQETDPGVAAEGWQTPDLDSAKEVDLDDKDFEAVVVIAADEKACWNAYIGSEALKGCGPSTYRVVGAPAALGMNAKSTSPEKNFLGIAVWDAEGDDIIQSMSTKKKFGTVALSAAIPPDV